LVVITPPFGQVPQVVQKLQSQWREYGIEVEIRQVPNLGGILAEFDKAEYNLIAFTDYGLEASILTRFYRSDGALNFSRWKNTDLDGWLDRALISTNDDERRALYGLVQMHIMENALLLPIRDYVNLNGAVSKVQNLAFDAYGWFPLLANVTVIEPSP
jgi:ABC-type transport system substrate-binding protein